jgi:hypothetical protein
VSTVTDQNQIQINESPSPVDISDFTVSTTLEGNLYSSGNLRVTGSGDHYISGGPVGIGTINPDNDAALTVGGMIRAQEVKITTDAGADFVFDKTYDLKTIHEVENFISMNMHLPDIPSEEEMIKNGIGMKEMQLKLLQKIEELTLYTIEQNKRIEDQNKRIQELEKILQKNKLR